MRFGLVGVPSVLFIHNGKVVAKYNDTSDPTLEGYVAFIATVAGLEPTGEVIITEEDQRGPVSVQRTTFRGVITGPRRCRRSQCTSWTTSW